MRVKGATVYVTATCSIDKTDIMKMPLRAKSVGRSWSIHLGQHGTRQHSE